MQNGMIVDKDGKVHFVTAGIKRARIDENGNFSTADGKIDTSIADDSWHEVGTAGEPAFENNWVNYDGTTRATAAFRKDALGFVHIKGMVKNGTIGQTIFTLPSGYRPPKYLYYPIASWDAYGQVYVNDAGQVIPTHGNNGWLCINIPPFYAG